MPIDPSIPLQAGTGAAAPQNPMAMMSQTVGVANGIAQNKLMGQSLETNQQALGATRLRAMGSIAATALSRFDPNDPAGHTNLVHALHDGLDAAVNNGTIDKNTAGQLFDGIAKTPNPADLVARVKQFALIGLDPNAALGRIYGANGTQSNGQDVQPGIDSNPMFPRPFQPVGQAVPVYPSREFLAGDAQVGVSSTGAPRIGPRAAVTPAPLAGPAGAAASPLGTGRLPPALTNPANAPQPTTGIRETGLGPAQTSAASATGAAGAARFADIADQGVQAQSQEALLNNMLSEATQFTTGPQQKTAHV